MHAFFKILLITLLFVSSSSFAKETCEKISKKDHDALIAKASKGNLDLIFFASWCESCVGKIKDAKGSKNTLLVGLYDEQSKLDEAYQFLKPGMRCIVGTESYVKTFKVTSLPHSVKGGKSVAR